MAALKEHAFSFFSPPVTTADLRAMIDHAVAAPEWTDGITVTSDRPDWISVAARCRRLTAERLIHFMDEISVDLPDDDRRQIGTAFREILLNAFEHGGRFDSDLEIHITRIKTPEALLYLIRDPGEGFDFDKLPHAAISHPDDPVRHVVFRDEHGMRPGGFGLLVASGMVDRVLHNAKGNEAMLMQFRKAGT